MKTNRLVGWSSAGAFSFGLLLLLPFIDNSTTTVISSHSSFHEAHQSPSGSYRTDPSNNHTSVDLPPQPDGNRPFTTNTDSIGEPKPIPPYIERALDWLASAQFENGGWGAGTHANQGVRDPHAVSIDPATTAFSGMALARAGNTLTEGPYRSNLKRALDYLLAVVEQSPADSPALTDLNGTQPQVKLGRFIDVSMVSQFLTRMLPETESDAKYHARVKNALDKCVHKIQLAQNADGSISEGGWAGVLQSAMANNALEGAADAGAKVDKDALKRSQDYQQANVSADGSVRTEAAAGVSLYSIASAQRAAAPIVRDARQRVERARKEGKISEEAELDATTLQSIGYSEDEARRAAETVRSYEKATEMLGSDDVLSGFGNNGGEEFLSYMMTSEALASAGGADWDNWYSRMNQRLEHVQNQNGSWSGHHCITSPVFSTAAVIMTITADRDAYRFAQK
ncbi:MAG: hypothetical protein KDD65_03735 [Bacteroidetes bacterium]|nr:hypothetical protein [Bacteroidota bacterium]